jgi:hypothetical protein
LQRNCHLHNLALFWRVIAPATSGHEPHSRSPSQFYHHLYHHRYYPSHQMAVLIQTASRKAP